MIRRWRKSKEQFNKVVQEPEQDELDDLLVTEDTEIPLIIFPQTSIKETEVLRDTEGVQAGMPQDAGGLQAGVVRDAVDIQAELLRDTEGVQTELLRNAEGVQTELLRNAEGVQAELLRDIEGVQAELLQDAEGVQAELLRDIEEVQAQLSQDAGELYTELSQKAGQGEETELDTGEFSSDPNLWELEPYEISQLSKGGQTMLPLEPSKHRIGRRFRRAVVAASLALGIVNMSVVICMSGTYAWYRYITHRSVYTEEREVMVPYYLYLLENTSTDYFHLNVVNMHPDEQKQVVFCVSNEDIQNRLAYSVGRTSDFNYELALSYTQNIPLKYKLYRLEQAESTDPGAIAAQGIPAGSGTPVTTYWKKSGGVLPIDTARSEEETTTNNQMLYADSYVSDGLVNAGKYDIYPKDAENKQLHLETMFADTSGSTQYPKHYYLIEIDWDESRSNSFSSYLKETDLVYVMVRAIQPRPEIKAEAAPAP